MLLDLDENDQDNSYYFHLLLLSSIWWYYNIYRHVWIQCLKYIIIYFPNTLDSKKKKIILHNSVHEVKS